MVSSKLLTKLRLIAIGLAFASSAQAFAYSVQMASSPESNLSLTVSAINSAQQSILVNIYDLSSPEIVQAITAQVGKGIHIEILQEGQPVGGISAAARGLQAGLIDAMNAAASDRYVEMTSNANGQKVTRRFRWDHAKYMVIDNSSLVLGSENYSPTGQPEPGTVGNRGWEVWVQDASLAVQFADMFASDSDPSNPDIQNLLGGRSNNNVAPTWDPGAVRSHDAAIGQAEVADINPIASPTTSEQGLLNLINSAQTSLLVEQMEFQPIWQSADGGTINSPLYDAMIQAAHRGVHVSVLLNDERVFAQGGKVDTKNTDAIAAFNQAASSEGIPIEARTANLKAMNVTYIHNKGALVDGNLTLVSSINWDQNSIQNNRETALILTSPDVYNFYASTFQSDWDNSATPDTSADPGGGQNPALLPESVASLIIPSVVDGDVSPEECPNAVSAAISIGAIDLAQSEVDPSFQTLQGFQDTVNFATLNSGASSNSDCTFRADTRMGPLFLQFRSHSSGSWLAVIEGYTRGGKLFSIRGTMPETDVEAGQSDVTAGVYPSSTSAKKVGSADLQIVLK